VSRAPLEEFLPVGPFTLTIKLPSDVVGRGVDCLVSRATLAATTNQECATFQLDSLVDHEVLVVS
jgi:hypothetical protein